MAENISTKLDPTIIVIFGITGDLSKRYLLPALYHLIKNGLLNEQTRIVGVTRGTTTASELFEKVEDTIKQKGETSDSQALAVMKETTTMFQMDLDDPKGYDSLLEKLNSLETDQGVCMNRLFYLSIPPNAYESVIELLGERKLTESCQHGEATARLLVEKPFGYDLESAEKLIATTSKAFSEEQIFRIDHYMAKETVQNILTFRFQNPIFEALWNNQHISSITISAKEKIGVEGRAVFYEPMGALRDFIQSHLIQILGIVTMEMPQTLDSDPIHTNKQTVLEQVKPVDSQEIDQRTLRGQYEGYRQEVKNEDSVTETYAEITVGIDNPRWQNVPITMLTGKALDERKTEVCVNFYGASGVDNNKLRFRIQPNEGIELDLITKKPGFDYDAQVTPMEFSYQKDFGDNSQPDAYERVLVDAVRGDHTLFATSEEVLASWRIVQPVLDAWSKSGDNLKDYKQGSTGPSGNTV
jgi:glucose-6-phosphate 1-dehydrogenase